MQLFQPKMTIVSQIHTKFVSNIFCCGMIWLKASYLRQRSALQDSGEEEMAGRASSRKCQGRVAVAVAPVRVGLELGEGAKGRVDLLLSMGRLCRPETAESRGEVTRLPS